MISSVVLVGKQKSKGGFIAKEAVESSPQCVVRSSRSVVPDLACLISCVYLAAAVAGPLEG